MRKFLAAVALVAAAAVATPARAADEGFTFALRSGYALPMGNLTSGISLSDVVSGFVPIWVDAGYRINKNILVGGYFQYGFASVKNGGPNDSAHDVRFGAEGMYNFMPDSVFSPWAGLGIGYEILSGTVASQDVSVKGFEFLNLQFGGDYKVSPMFSVGPFVAFSLASYSSASVGGQDQPGFQSGTHEWLQFGLKGTFNL